MPNGEQLPTNQWFRKSDDYEIGLVHTTMEDELHLIIGTDSSAIATITLYGQTYEAVVTDFRIQGPKYRGEYWVTTGKELSPELVKKSETEPSVEHEAAVAGRFPN